MLFNTELGHTSLLFVASSVDATFSMRGRKVQVLGALHFFEVSLADQVDKITKYLHLTLLI